MQPEQLIAVALVCIVLALIASEMVESAARRVYERPLNHHGA